jgi:hypothetical protein
MNVLLFDFGGLASTAPTRTAEPISTAAQTSGTTPANRLARRTLAPIVIHEGICSPSSSRILRMVMHWTPTPVVQMPRCSDGVGRVWPTGAKFDGASIDRGAEASATPVRSSKRPRDELLVARGNGAEALRAYEQLRQRLRDELGATPSPGLRALQEGLLRR